MTHVLVTGATGFVGRALVSALVQQGCAVRASVRRRPPVTFPPDVEVIEQRDLGEPVDWRRALEGVAKVIHLAGIAHSRGVPSERYEAVNRLATERLAAASAEQGIAQFVFISSVRAQSGACADRVLTERDPPRPTDAYGRSKLAAEESVRRAGVPFTILRPVGIYGPGGKGSFALLMELAKLPLPLPLLSFCNRRSLLGIDNFISATEFVLSNPNTIGEMYLVADPGVPLTLAELFSTVRRAHRGRSLLWPMPPSCIEVPLRMMGRGGLWERFGSDLEVNAAKLIAAGWRPTHDTNAGLTSLAEGAQTRRLLRPAAAGRPPSA